MPLIELQWRARLTLPLWPETRLEEIRSAPGILRTPGEIAAQLRSSALVIAVWVLGGRYAFLCTLSVTELGTMLPCAGGWYVYSRRAFGE